MRDKRIESISDESSGGKHSISLKKRLFLYWGVLIVIIFFATLLVLGITGVIPGTNAKVSQALKIQQDNTLAEISRQSERMTAKSIILSKKSTEALNKVLGEKGKKISDLNNNQELIRELENAIYPALLATLDIKDCSGAFVVFDATVNTEAEHADTSRMGIYLRNSDLKTINTYEQHIVYFRGMPDIARSEQVQMHNRWNLEFDITGFPGYEKVIESGGGRLAENCLWTTRIKLKDTWESAQFLCVPILDSAGKPCGVCGMEISSLYFRLQYPRMKGEYGNMITVIAPMDQNGMLLMDEAMLGDSKETYLSPTGTMTVKSGRKFNTYSAESQRYIGRHTALKLQPAGYQPLVAATLISERSYKKVFERNQMWWMIGGAVFLIVLVGLSVYLAGHFLRPILKGLRAVQGEDSSDRYSGISEVDSLIAFLDSKNSEKTVSGTLPEDIEEMLVSFSGRASRLTPAERTLLQHYIDGYTIEESASLLHISISTARKHNTNLNKKLGISTREELMLYIELFKKCGKLEVLLS